jgi:hypothetical protein
LLIAYYKKGIAMKKHSIRRCRFCPGMMSANAGEYDDLSQAKRSQRVTGYHDLS